MIKILMLTSTWDNPYCSETIRGIQKRLDENEEEIKIDIFNVYDETQKNYVYYKQLELFTLPNLEEYDGMLLTISSTDFLHAVNDIKVAFEATGKPIVTTDQIYGDSPFCGIDNYAAMYKMVEHVIAVHDAKVLNYIGGPKNYQEDILRCMAFTNCLAAHGIEHNPERELHFSFLTNDGCRAYEIFKQKNLLDADAIICANDHMAVGFLDSAKQDGLTAPDDFIITGFDNVEFGQTYMPSITSVNRDRVNDGYEALSALLRMIAGEPDVVPNTTTGFVVENESCGCGVGKRNLAKEYERVIQQKREILNMQYAQAYARQRLCSSTSMEQFLDAMSYSQDKINMEPFAVCISHTFFEGHYEEEQKYFTDEMNCYFDGQTITFTRSKDGVIPAKWTEKYGSAITLISPLVFGYQTQGYMICPWQEFIFEIGGHKDFIDSVSLALENISQRITLDSMNRKLQKLYVKDPLTNLYNRFGYASLSNGFFEKNLGRVYLMFMDLDKLKHINDFYGHAMGDLAIKGAAHAIAEAFYDTDIHVRMGGDEFLVMGSLMDEDELIEREEMVLESLKRYSKDNDMPVVLEASMGHVINDGFNTGYNLETLVSQADKKMYVIKQGKKAKQ